MVRAKLSTSYPCVAASLAVVMSAIWSTPATAEPKWAKLVPFKKVEADPQQDYDLEEKQGPWMIMACSFAGPTAEQQSPEALATHQKAEIDRWWPTIKAANIKAE